MASSTETPDKNTSQASILGKGIPVNSTALDAAIIALRLGSVGFSDPNQPKTKRNKFENCIWDSSANYLLNSGAASNYHNTAFSQNSAEDFITSAKAVSASQLVASRMVKVERHIPKTENMVRIMATLEILQMYCSINEDASAEASLANALGQMEIYDKATEYAAKLKSESNLEGAKIVTQFANENSPSVILEAARISMQNGKSVLSAEMEKEVGALANYYEKSQQPQSPVIVAATDLGTVIEGLSRINVKE